MMSTCWVSFVCYREALTVCHLGQKLESINLASNLIGDIGAQHLAMMLRKNEVCGLLIMNQLRRCFCFCITVIVWMQCISQPNRSGWNLSLEWSPHSQHGTHLTSCMLNFWLFVTHRRWKHWRRSEIWLTIGLVIFSCMPSRTIQ